MCHTDAFHRLLFAVLGTLAAGIGSMTAVGQDSLSQQADEAAEALTDHRYLLQYKSKPGQQLDYKVEHMVTVKTKVDGTTQRSQSRSVSGKRWKFQSVDSQSLTFVHSVDYVEMWQETQGQVPIRYDSRSGEEVPPEYEEVAQMVGKPISTVKISRAGKELNREDAIKQHDMGTGGLVVPLPEQPVRIGAEWSVPTAVPVQLSDGTFKTINIRQRYRLEKVETGIATISIASQVLTPSIDPRIHSKLVQRMSHGTLKFDLEHGRVVSKTLEWNEKVVGFNGASSQMEYVARMTDEYQDARVASTR